MRDVLAGATVYNIDQTYKSHSLSSQLMVLLYLNHSSKTGLRKKTEKVGMTFVLDYLVYMLFGTAILLP